MGPDLDPLTVYRHEKFAFGAGDARAGREWQGWQPLRRRRLEQEGTAARLCHVDPWRVRAAVAFSSSSSPGRPRPLNRPSPVWLKDGLPVRKLRLEPFYLDGAEVTNERYAKILAVAARRITGARARCRKASRNIRW